MKQWLALGALLAMLFIGLHSSAADEDDTSSAKEALKEVQDFIGEWNGTGGPDKARPSPRDPIWNEKIDWSWRFKGKDAWLTMSIARGKLFKKADLRYLPATETYQLTTVDQGGKKLVYEGKLKKDVLTLERVDPDSKETQQIRMNVAAEGVRFIYRVAHRSEGSTIWKRDYVIACTREGESLAKRETKNVCVVTGGLGTKAVSYMGETFWVCCSGCEEAFKENPAKYVAEFKAKKNKK
jgi:hypothetical protein